MILSTTGTIVIPPKGERGYSLRVSTRTVMSARPVHRINQPNARSAYLIMAQPSSDRWWTQHWLISMALQWNLLTSANRMSWITYANSNNWVNRRGKSKKISGFNWFLVFNMTEQPFTPIPNVAFNNATGFGAPQKFNLGTPTSLSIANGLNGTSGSSGATFGITLWYLPFGRRSFIPASSGGWLLMNREEGTPANTNFPLGIATTFPPLPQLTQGATINVLMAGLTTNPPTPLYPVMTPNLPIVA